MKKFSVLVILLFNFTVINAQKKIFGKYKNEFGEVLTLNSDKTFEYSWRFDLASSWNIGTWRVEKGKYIHLTTNEIKDTLKNQNKIELVLSNDRKSNKITNEEQAMNSISGGGQSRNLPPKKLLIKNQKLFPYSKSGEIQSKRLQSLMDRNIFSKPWFEKVPENEY
ncbi:MAG: hypothetical protein P0Y62_03455 [Candidatus Chryseobacterium colombiense]|nr:hypothetical protein [Chryseobacterium sp.]WEK70614.1 MAG: hypothetical protein P0Y62_03455 [Chryseobacterium sp.]